jgi:predicted metal-dependent peptidase
VSPAARAPQPHERACDEALTRFRLRALRTIPFYATLALHAKFVHDESVPIAATDGARVLLNPRRMSALDDPEFAFVVIHELMHIANAHLPRRRNRAPYPWNIVTDALINDTISDAGRAPESLLKVRAPEGVVTIEALARILDADPDALRSRSAEELYAMLERAVHERAPEPPPAGGGGGDADGDAASDLAPEHRGLEAPDGDFTTRAWSDLGDEAPGQSDDERAANEAHWRRALASAATLQREHETRHPGTTPAGLKRLLGDLGEPRLDWRTLLWHHLSALPYDYSGFDRRFIQYGTYQDALSGDTLAIDVCIDTSGSIDRRALSEFGSELAGILAAYPKVGARLYYADTELHGPFEIETLYDAPPPIGGGGTSFRPFFEALEHDPPASPNPIAVYFTDGYGAFPPHEPEHATLWAVQPGGANDAAFPFGEVVRIDPDA